MTDRLTIDGEAVIEEDDATGDITVRLSEIIFGENADFAFEFDAGAKRVFVKDAGEVIAAIGADRVNITGSGSLNLSSNTIDNIGRAEYDTVDVRTLSSPLSGETAYHDGSGTNTEGPAHYTSNDEWVSTVDGTTIT